MTVVGPLCPVQILRTGKTGDFSLLLFSSAVLPGLIPIRQDVLDQKEQSRTSHIGCKVTINIENNSVSAWFLKQGFYPDVVGNGELEICFEEIHFFLLIVETNTLFAGLVLRKSRLNPREMERVGFCCGNAGLYSQGDDARYDDVFEDLLEFLRGMSKSTITVL
jgi:hypothetical protein